MGIDILASPTGGPGTDTTAIHTDTGGEISALSAIVLADGDSLITEDADDSNAKKKLLASALYTYTALKLEADKYGITIGTSDPTVNDDSGSGFSVGNLMANTATPSFWRCSDVTVGAAVWTDLSGGGSWVGTATSDLDMNGNDIIMTVNDVIKNHIGDDVLQIKSTGTNGGALSIAPCNGAGLRSGALIDTGTDYLTFNCHLELGASKNIHIEQTQGIKTTSSTGVKSDKWLLKFFQNNSAVNNFQISNAVSGSGPILEAEGSDTNIPVEIKPKGTSYTDLKAGGIVVNRTATATSVSSSLADTIIGVTDTSSAWTVTLDTDTVVEGHITIIKDESGAAGTNNITIDTEGAETIDGAATATISTNYGVIRLYCDGANFFII